MMKAAGSSSSIMKHNFKPDTHREPRGGQSHKVVVPPAARTRTPLTRRPPSNVYIGRNQSKLRKIVNTLNSEK